MYEYLYEKQLRIKSFVKSRHFETKLNMYVLNRRFII